MKGHHRIAALLTVGMIGISLAVMITGCSQTTARRPQESVAAVPHISNPNKGVWCWNCITETGTSATIDANVRGNLNIRGYSVTIPWAQLEPSDGVFDWSEITTLEAQLGVGQYLAIYPLLGLNGPAWLLAATAHDTYIWPSNFEFPKCSTHQYPIFTDLVYQTKWKAFVDAFDTQFHNDSKIARTDIQPFSDQGFRTGLSSPCPQPGTSTCNRSGQQIINGGPPTGCLGNDHIAQWRSHSACGTDQTCFQNLVTSNYDSLFSYEFTKFTGATFQITGWFAPQQFPNLAWTGSGPNTSGTIAPLLINFAHATAGADFMVGNEALPTGWVNFLAPFCATGIPCIGQMLTKQTRTPADCPALKSADDAGISRGISLIEEYEPDILNCPAEIARVKTILDPTVLNGAGPAVEATIPSLPKL